MLTVYAYCLLALCALTASKGNEVNRDSSPEIHQLIGRMNHLEQQISDQHEMIEDLAAENHFFKKEIQSKSNQDCSPHVSEIHKIQALESKMSALEEEIHKEVKRQNTFISFRAFPTENRVYTGGEILIFDNDVVNLGQGYITENSTFVCPYNAYYMFTVTVMQAASTLMRAHLLLEGSILHRNRSDDAVTHDQATVVVVTLCEAGQRVWVEAWGSESEFHLYGINYYSSFSGTLLRVV